MKQTIQWKNKSIQIDIGLILILILFGMTSCFALYNSFNLIKFGSGSSYLYRQLFWFIVGFVEAGVNGEFGFVTPVMTEGEYEEKAKAYPEILHMIRVEEEV